MTANRACWGNHEVSNTVWRIYQWITESDNPKFPFSVDKWYGNVLNHLGLFRYCHSEIIMPASSRASFKYNRTLVLEVEIRRINVSFCLFPFLTSNWVGEGEQLERALCQTSSEMNAVWSTHTHQLGQGVATGGHRNKGSDCNEWPTALLLRSVTLLQRAETEGRGSNSGDSLRQRPLFQPSVSHHNRGDLSLGQWQHAGRSACFCWVTLRVVWRGVMTHVCTCDDSSSTSTLFYTYKKKKVFLTNVQTCVTSDASRTS